MITGLSTLTFLLKVADCAVSGDQRVTICLSAQGYTKFNYSTKAPAHTCEPRHEANRRDGPRGGLYRIKLRKHR